ncbi:hypothetical protein HYH03_015879 [Edaphochlamys debaryana]|uniref:Uncharacterized protein n=1 Tax=Edaphochlamys debaryana TaxID=47281 RepID=A0A835XMA8_9CHLO|nr:hypothetical protein HYH03_015879 [Edaphochlamys debaryana]|eukprot:KAG2485393.1 hypothetical protein HYH03_015879 [Edaphochlamys debaryana]
MATALQLALLEPDAGRVAVTVSQQELQRNLREEKAGHGSTKLALAEAQQARYAAEASALRAEQRADALAEEVWQLREQLERAASSACSDAGPAAGLQLRAEEVERRAAEHQQSADAAQRAAAQAEQRAQVLEEAVRQLKEQLSRMQERSEVDAELKAELQRRADEAERRAAECKQSAEAAQKGRAEANTTTNQLRREVAHLLEQNSAALEGAAAQAQQLKQQLESAEERYRRTDLALGKQNSRVTTLTRQHKEALARANEAQKRVADLEQQVKQAAGQREALEHDVEALEHDVKALEDWGNGLEANVEEAEELLDSTETAAKMLTWKACWAKAALHLTEQQRYEAEQRVEGAEGWAEDAEHAAQQCRLEAAAARAATQQKLEAAELVEAGPMLAVLRQLLSAMEPGPAGRAQEGVEAAQREGAGEQRAESSGGGSQEAERTAKRVPLEAEPDQRQQQLEEAGLVDAGLVAEVLQTVISSTAVAPGSCQVEAGRLSSAAGGCAAGADNTGGPRELAAPQPAGCKGAAQGPPIKQEPVDGPDPSPAHRRKQDRPHRCPPDGAAAGDQGLPSGGPGGGPLSQKGIEEPAAKRARP